MCKHCQTRIISPDTKHASIKAHSDICRSAHESHESPAANTNTKPLDDRKHTQTPKKSNNKSNKQVRFRTRRQPRLAYSMPQEIKEQRMTSKVAHAIENQLESSRLLYVPSSSSQHYATNRSIHRENAQKLRLQKKREELLALQRQRLKKQFAFMASSRRQRQTNCNTQKKTKKLRFAANNGRKSLSEPRTHDHQFADHKHAPHKCDCLYNNNKNDYFEAVVQPNKPTDQAQLHQEHQDIILQYIQRTHKRSPYQSYDPNSLFSILQDTEPTV